VLSHFCLGTNDAGRATRFYDAVLGALGLERCEGGEEGSEQEWRGWRVYGSQPDRQITLWVCRPFDGRAASAGNGTMIAFDARSWSQVDRFHAAALEQGGSSEGAPGLRPHYYPDFYAAYVRDPDGNKLAAVCRGFTQPQER
jgi:catechol 2,3-dioxygenase-like lactoylglutathione lyase family enzyme